MRQVRSDLVKNAGELSLGVVTIMYYHYHREINFSICQGCHSVLGVMDSLALFAKKLA